MVLLLFLFSLFSLFMPLLASADKSIDTHYDYTCVFQSINKKDVACIMLMTFKCVRARGTITLCVRATGFANYIKKKLRVILCNLQSLYAALCPKFIMDALVGKYEKYSNMYCLISKCLSGFTWLSTISSYCN